MKAGNLTIRWRYTPTEKITQCQIIGDDIIIGEGQSLLGNKDHFQKEKGRKLSIARAMFDMDMPKEECKVIWELYRNMKPSGRW